jgi:hypothetical protein
MYFITEVAGMNTLALVLINQWGVVVRSVAEE